MTKTMTVALVAFALVAAGNALAQDREAIAAGSAIYREKCVDCHGPGMASTGAGADLRELRANERPRFDKVINEGKGQMPAWGGVLTAEEIDQLWAYQRSRAND